MYANEVSKRIYMYSVHVHVDVNICCITNGSARSNQTRMYKYLWILFHDYRGTTGLDSIQ